MKKIYLLGATLTLTFACNKTQTLPPEISEVQDTILKTEKDTIKKSEAIDDNLNYKIEADENGKIKMIF